MAEEDPVGHSYDPPQNSCAAAFGIIADSTEFSLTIFAAIVVGAVSVGLQTNTAWSTSPVFKTLNAVVLWLFVAEALVKALALAPRMYRYLLDPWNLFDLAVLSIGLYQFIASPYGAIIVVARVLRLLRVLRMLTQFPELALVVGTLFGVLPLFGWLLGILCVLLYIYGVIGVLIFSSNDPVHFGNLGDAFLTLFRVMTADDWAHVMAVNLQGCRDEYRPPEAHQCTHSEGFGVFAAVYFGSFLFVAGMVLVNLMVAISCSQMESLRQELTPSTAAEQPGEDPASTERHKELMMALRELEDKIEQQTRDIVELQQEMN